MWGLSELDEATPSTIPYGKFVEIKSSSHSIVNEKKAAILKVVKQFITQI